MNYHFADFDRDDFDDQQDLTNEILMELAQVFMTGNDLDDPEVAEWLRGVGEEDPAQFLLIHKRVVAKLHAGMIKGGQDELQRLYDTDLLPIEKGPVAKPHEVSMTIQVMAIDPKQAARMVAGHVSFRMPLQFISAEIDPHAPPDDGDLPGAGPSGELQVPG